MALEPFFAKPLPLLEHPNLASIPAPPTLKRMPTHRNRHEPKAPLSSVLDDFQQTLSIQPVAKVNGLLSLVAQSLDLAPGLDSRKGKSGAHVFWGVVLESSIPHFSLPQIMAVLAPSMSRACTLRLT